MRLSYAAVLLTAALVSNRSYAQQATTTQQGWSRAEDIWTNTGEGQSSPEVAAAGGVPTVALFPKRWSSDRLLIVGDTILVARRVDDRWTVPSTLWNEVPSHFPNLISDGTSLSVVAPQGDGPFATDRLMLLSSSPAASPVAETIVAYDTSGPRPHVAPSFQHAISYRGQPAVLYEEATDHGSVVTFTRRRPEGGWTAPRQIEGGFYESLDQASDGTLVATYLSVDMTTGRQAVVVAVSRDGGEQWDLHDVAERPRGERHSTPRAIQTADGTLHVAWLQSSDNTQDFDKVQYAFSTTGGHSWSAVETLQAGRPWFNLSIQLVGDDGSRPHLFVFQTPDVLGSEGEIVHTGRRADGRWTPQTPLFGARNVWWAPRVPSLAVSDGRLHAAWENQVNGSLRVQYASAPVGWLAAQVRMSGGPARVDARAFPNPASESVTFVFAPAAAGAVTLRVTTSDGRSVVEERLGERPVGAQRHTISTAGLASGLYLFEVAASGETFRGTFTVLRTP